MSQHPVRAKKALGQHFLNDKNIAQNIVKAMTESSPSHVLEVGPGTGVLTQFLLKEDYETKFVEIDEESVAYLLKVYPTIASKLIEQDFLTLDFKSLGWDKLSIIGNFPYNISSQIFFKILDYRDMVPCVVGMLQKEVAERISSRPGTKDYGILSVLLQAWYKIDYLFTVSEHVFTPPPKVKSAVVKLVRLDNCSIGCDESLFKTIVKTAFNQRRKMLSNSLKTVVDTRLIDDAIMSKRPEQLSVDDFVRLTNLCKQVIIN